jgi:hypothetical protein
MALGENIIKLFLILFFVYFGVGSLSGCTHGHCKRVQKEKTINGPQEESLTNPNKRQMNVYKKRVLVFKYDGTLQCQAWKGISLDEMEKELSPITVISKNKKHDGQVRIQVCGSGTGKANVFEIYEEDLESALKKGFKLWDLQ